MGETPSQEEITGLFSGIASSGLEGKSDTRERQYEREIVRFDFRLPHRLHKRQLQTLSAIHENFAETFSSYLVSRLQTTVSINVESVDQIFYSEYILSTIRPSCLYVFRIGKSDASAVIELSPTLVLAIISLLLGGSADGKSEPRTITKIEQNIIRGIVLRALADLEKSWATITESRFKLERYETEGDFVQIAPTSEIVLVISFELSIGEQKHRMSVCFPTFALEDDLAKLNVQNFTAVSRASDRHVWSDEILKKLESTRILATCVLGEATLNLNQLKELEPGDVLVTNTAITGELQVMFGGRIRAYGRPGVSNGKAAIRITHIVQDSESKE